ncbi:MAG: hypothetical protein A3F72_19835 [Bacteroidetes bacterium RIFCSPLOWO2_12_FULL_35_15]|nr:MAG: hypothetical protein A3F72_19835 [Bacteroidetes bacterium RIFCSPLOWO2_12_FULL_35_15]
MAKKSTKPHKEAKPKSKAGLKGAEKLKAAKKGLTEQIAKPSGVLGGLVAASIAINLMEKIPFLQTPEDDGTGKFSIKKIVKPIILVAVGATAVAFTHKKTGIAMQFANGLGYGVAGGGLIAGVKAVTGKSLVDGLGRVDMRNGRAVLEANYYKHQAHDMAKMLEENKFNPNLNSAERHIEYQPKSREEMNGSEEMGGPNNWGDTLDAESSSTII